MKTFSASLLTSYSKSVTTIAKCIKIIRSDGVTYTFTSFDKDLTIDGEIYKSSYAFNPTAYNSALGLQIENMEIEGAIDELNINDLDIVKKLFYGAEAWLFSVDYKDLAAGKDKILYGTVGEVEVTDKVYKFEIRGISKRYESLYSSYYGKMCRARLGDSKCGLDLSAVVLDPLANPVNMIVTGAVTSNEQIVLSAFRVAFRFKCTTTITSEIKVKSIDLISTTEGYVVPTQVTQSGTDNHYCGATVCSINNLFDNNLTTYACIPINSNYSPYYYLNLGYYSNIFRIEITDDSSYNTHKINEIEIYTSPDGTYWTKVFTTLDTPYRSGNKITIPMAHLFSSTNTKYKFYSSDLTAEKLVNLGLVYNDEQYIANSRNIFQYGNVKWLTGLNSGLETEVIFNDEFGNVELAIPMPFNINYLDTFLISVGCNHLLYGADGLLSSGHCFKKFNNILNFRGEPYLPNEDIILSGFVGQKAETEQDTEGENSPILLKPAGS